MLGAVIDDGVGVNSGLRLRYPVDAVDNYAAMAAG